MQLAVRNLGVHEAVSHIHFRAESSHSLDMLINGPYSEIASAGHCGFRASETAEHSADKIIGGADLAHQLKRRIAEPNIAAVNLDRAGAQNAHLGAELRENGQQHICIAYLRHILNTAHAVNHECRRNDSNRRVFCSAYINFALKRFSTVYDVFFHMLHLSLTQKHRFVIIA